jgi:hypothetical protein
MATTHLGYWIARREREERLQQCRLEENRKAYQAFRARPNAKAEAAAVDAEARRRAAMGSTERAAQVAADNAAVEAAVAARRAAAVRIQRAVRGWQPATEEAYCLRMATYYTRKAEVLKFRRELKKYGRGDLDGFAGVLYDLDIKSLVDVEKRYDELLWSEALNDLGFTRCQKQSLLVAAKQKRADDDKFFAAFCKERRAEAAAEERRDALWWAACTGAAAAAD